MISSCPHCSAGEALVWVVSSKEKDMIKPLGSRVLIAVDKKEEMTEGGIYIPESARDDKEATTGEVLEIGADAEMVSAGDVVVFDKYAGQDINIEGFHGKLIDEADILAVKE
jgi:chaperonin GroES